MRIKRGGSGRVVNGLSFRGSFHYPWNTDLGGSLARMEEGYGGLAARVEGAWCSRASDGGERSEHKGERERGLEALEETKGVFSPR